MTCGELIAEGQCWGVALGNLNGGLVNGGSKRGGAPGGLFGLLPT